MHDASRRWRKTLRARAPLEVVFTGLAYAAYAVAVGSLVAAAFLLLTIGQRETAFPAGEGFLKAIKGYGIGLFGVAAIVFYSLGRWLLESRVPGARREAEARYEASRIATELAADPDFQRAGSWEWRERVAYDLVPALKEYAESDDWADRRFARQTVKEAWEIHRRAVENA